MVVRSKSTEDQRVRFEEINQQLLDLDKPIQRTDENVAKMLEYTEGRLLSSQIMIAHVLVAHQRCRKRKTHHSQLDLGG